MQYVGVAVETERGAVRVQQTRCGGWGVVALALAACGTPLPSPYGGAWTGGVKRTQAMWVPGMGNAPPTTSNAEYPTAVWSIGVDEGSCGKTLTVGFLQDCPLKAEPSADGFAFVPGSWCEARAANGSTSRYTALDGSLKLADMRVDGKVAKVLAGTVHVSVLQKGSGNGTYVELTDVFSDGLLTGEIIGHNSCVLLKTDPWVPEDMAAAAKCDAFVDRTAPAADRTIAITAGTFTPTCVRVATGQTVTFVGPWSLKPGVPGDQGAGAPGSPIPTISFTGSVDATFTRAGDYPFFSTVGAPPAQGLIRVR